MNFLWPSYAETLRRWQNDFLQAWPEIQDLGFDDRFRRMWLYYLCYSEVGFDTGTTDVAQFTLTRHEIRHAGLSKRRLLLAYALPAFVVALPTIPVFIHSIPLWRATGS